MRPLPRPLVKAPGRLKSVLNALIDFCREAKPRAGFGLEINETPDGIELSVNKTLQDIIRNYVNATSGLSDNPDNNLGNNPFTGTTQDAGNGTFEWPASSLVTVDVDTGDLETTPNRLIAMREINVCVDAGNGSYTPAKMKVLGTATYT